MSEPITSNEQYHIHISSEHKLLDLNLKEVWKYRDLILLFTKRNFAVRYKQTILGPAWLFLNPFITSVMHTIVFGRIAKIGTDGIPQILFHLTGSAFWSFFSSCLVGNASTFTANARVFGKVYFPRLTTPISNVLSNAIQFGIQMTMVLGFLIYFSINKMVVPNWLYFFLIPFLLIQLGLMGMGVGIIISSLTTKYRDLSVLVGFGMSLWMYGTPVVYPLSTISDGLLKQLVMLNPVTAPIELFRYIVLGRGAVMPEYLVYSRIFTIIVALLGIIIFNKVERTFMDTV
ncbi:MAG: ABC transporter permease [Erysipelotrichaceae bacterium]|nr:ABC transporter permease [Erysipelotrichaceae bacterium]